MKTSIFNINRVAALLRYDWMLNKRMMGMTALVITSIFAFIALIYFVIHSQLPTMGGEALPGLVATFTYSFFSYANVAMVLVVTTILSKKFCEPRTSTSYLTLPGTSLEKYTVMLLDYLFGWLGVWTLYLVLFYITMFLCSLSSPEYDWTCNPFVFFDAQRGLDFMSAYLDGPSISEIGQQMNSMELGLGDAETDFILLATRMAPITALISFGFYIVLNMLFTNNTQIKSIVCYYLTGFVLVVIAIVFGICWVVSIVSSTDAMSDQVAAEFLNTAFSIANYVLYALPVLVVALFFIFYRQICRKQAK
ncbi:MAG: hypothetical protein KBT20_05530 [Bacteroidales bacterium]|nr:hypothetical protein [Candidatus Liminaster caballi]